jgi:hypothetical protein
VKLPALKIGPRELAMARSLMTRDNIEKIKYAAVHGQELTAALREYLDAYDATKAEDGKLAAQFAEGKALYNARNYDALHASEEAVEAALDKLRDVARKILATEPLDTSAWEKVSDISPGDPAPEDPSSPSGADMA